MKHSLGPVALILCMLIHTEARQADEMFYDYFNSSDRCLLEMQIALSSLSSTTGIEREQAGSYVLVHMY